MDSRFGLRRQCGMTLLELLVVMTLLALVTSLLMQGFGSALSTYERVQRRQVEGVPFELGYRWFTETLSGAQAELDSLRQLHGDSQGFSGVTHRPLLGNAGQVSFFAWQLSRTDDQRLQLIYRQPGQVEWFVASWPAGSQGRFVYRSLQGEPVERWPDSYEEPQSMADGRIPGAILLEITPAEGVLVRWYANLPGRTFPRPDYREM